MQEELQGTTFSEAAQRINRTHRADIEAAGYETGKTAQACHRIESLLDEMLAELPEKRSLTLLQGNLILSLVVALLFPLLIYGFSSMGSSGNLDNLAASVVLFMIAGVVLSALLAGNTEAGLKQDHRRIPWLYRSGFLSRDRELNERYIANRLHYHDAARLLIKGAEQESSELQLRERIKLLALWLAPAAPRVSVPFLLLSALSTRLLLVVLLMLFISYYTLAMYGVSNLGIFCPMFAGLAFYLYYGFDKRGQFSLPSVAACLRPAIAYYRQRDSLDADRRRDAVVPLGVPVQSGSGILELLAVEMKLNLSRRGTGLSRYVPASYLFPLTGVIFAAVSGLSMLFAISDFLVALMYMAWAVVIIFAGWLLFFRIDRIAGDFRCNIRRECTSRGRLQELAMGQLPIDELHASCPVFMRNLLYRPGMPHGISSAALRHCWTLMWNADWFAGFTTTQVRGRWHAYWQLIFQYFYVSPCILTIYYAPFTPESYSDSSSIYIYVLSVVLVLVLLYIYYKTLLQSALHNAGAWAVVDCLEELVQTGEQVDEPEAG